MPAIGGPVESMSIDGRSFAVAQDADVAIDLGGDSNSIEMNGNSTGRIIKEKTPWKTSSVAIEIDDDRDDMQFIQDVRDSSDYVDMEITLVNGDVYYGQGTITDTAERSTKSSTMEVTPSGPGRLTKQ